MVLPPPPSALKGSAHSCQHVQAHVTFDRHCCSRPFSFLFVFLRPFLNDASSQALALLFHMLSLFHCVPPLISPSHGFLERLAVQLFFQLYARSALVAFYPDAFASSSVTLIFNSWGVHFMGSLAWASPPFIFTIFVVLTRGLRGSCTPKTSIHFAVTLSGFPFSQICHFRSLVPLTIRVVFLPHDVYLPALFLIYSFGLCVGRSL